MIVQKAFIGKGVQLEAKDDNGLVCAWGMRGEEKGTEICYDFMFRRTSAPLTAKSSHLLSTPRTARPNDAGWPIPPNTGPTARVPRHGDTREEAEQVALP